MPTRGEVNRAGHVVAVRVQVAALGHRQVMQHGRRRRGEVLRLDLHRHMLLNQHMPGQMPNLRAERLPDVVIARPGSRIARLHSELNVVENLEFPVAEGHFDGRTVVEAASP